MFHVCYVRCVKHIESEFPKDQLGTVRNFIGAATKRKKCSILLMRFSFFLSVQS